MENTLAKDSEPSPKLATNFKLHPKIHSYLSKTTKPDKGKEIIKSLFLIADLLLIFLLIALILVDRLNFF